MLSARSIQSGWNRPAQITETLARDSLTDAINDYAIQRENGYINSDDPILKHLDPDFHAALEQWQDRPQLQPAPFLHIEQKPPTQPATAPRRLRTLRPAFQKG